MSAWTRLSSYRRLICVEISQPQIEATAPGACNLETMRTEMHKPHLLCKGVQIKFSILQGPPILLCFQSSELGKDVQVAFSPQCTTMFPIFFGDGDAYLFLGEEVCSMMQFPNAPQDIVRLHFIPFALKDSAKLDA